MDSVSNIRVLHGEVTRLNMNMTLRLSGVDMRQGEQDTRLALIESKLDRLLEALGGSSQVERVSGAGVAEARLEKVSEREASGLDD